MEEILRTKLIPLYRNLLNNLSTPQKICTFCMQWGNEFPKEENSGILFIGKATNGWVSKSRIIDVLFGADNKEMIFARKDQLIWVENSEGDKKYNTRKSSFWRIIKKISKNKNGQENWSKKIAWSNLYKLGFEKGNPDEKLKKNQIETCKKILEIEIKILSPKYLIFLTSEWEEDFINYLTIDKIKENPKSIEWGKNYKTYGFTVDSLHYIISVHPQGKNENEHFKKINDIMKHLG